MQAYSEAFDDVNDAALMLISSWAISKTQRDKRLVSNEHTSIELDYEQFQLIQALHEELELSFNY